MWRGLDALQQIGRRKIVHLERFARDFQRKSVVAQRLTQTFSIRVIAEITAADVNAEDVLSAVRVLLLEEAVAKLEERLS